MFVLLSMAVVLAAFFTTVLWLDPARRRKSAVAAVLAGGAFALSDTAPTVGGDAFAQEDCTWDGTTLTCPLLFDPIPGWSPPPPPPPAPPPCYSCHWSPPPPPCYSCDQAPPAPRPTPPPPPPPPSDPSVCRDVAHFGMFLPGHQPLPNGPSTEGCTANPLPTLPVPPPTCEDLVFATSLGGAAAVARAHPLVGIGVSIAGHLVSKACP